MCVNILYTAYAFMFACRRGCFRFFFQEDEPRKQFTVEIPGPKYPWLYISAVWDDGEEEDVTDEVEEHVEPGELLTPARLFEITQLEPEERSTKQDPLTFLRKLVKWSYMDSLTFEVREITSDGLVNVVKPKSD